MSMTKSNVKKRITAIIALILGLATLLWIAVSASEYRLQETAKISAEYLADKDVKIIAHRGLSSKFYENSEEAFLVAAKSSFFYGIETDVHFTADGVAVCSHDDNAFEDQNVNITSSTYDEIRNMPLKKNAYGFKGARICDFETYLGICASYNKVAVIELKQWSLNEDQIRHVTDKAKEICGQDFVIISFSKSNIQVVNKIDDKIVTQHLVSDAESLKNSLNEGFNISDYFRRVNKSVVDDTHSKGKKVGVWTVNNLNEMVRYANLGVDYITTDFDFLNNEL